MKKLLWFLLIVFIAGNAAFAVNQLGVERIAAPVLLVCADNDALFPPESCDLQAHRYPGAQSLDVLRLANTGHALTVERSAGELRNAVSAWLKDHGY